MTIHDDHSDAGLQIISNQDCYLSDGQLLERNKIHRDKYERKKNKEARKQIRSQRQQQRDNRSDIIEQHNLCTDFREKLVVTPPRTPAPSSPRKESDEKDENEVVTRKELHNVIQTAVDQALQKYIEQNKVKPEKEELPEEFDDFIHDDLNARIKDFSKHKDSGYNPDFDVKNASQRRKEMEHWRLHNNVEDRQQVAQYGATMKILTGFIESICGAFDIHLIETEGLTDSLDAELSEGKLNYIIKQIVDLNGEDSIFKNPKWLLATSVLDIFRRNHFNKKKRKYTQSKKNTKRERKNRKMEISSDDDDDDSDNCKHSRKRRNYSHPPPPPHYYGQHPYYAPHPNYYQHPPPQHYYPQYQPTEVVKPKPRRNIPTPTPTPEVEKPNENKTRLSNKMIIDPFTKKPRIKISASSITELPIQKVVDGVSKFNPVFKQVNNHVKEQEEIKKIQADLKSNIPQPKSL